MGRPLQRFAQGLTMIELLVVVAVIGVLVALTAPSMRDLISKQRVAGINAELVTDLQFARSEAARRNRRVFVKLDPVQRCYVIYTDVATGNCDCSRTPGVDVCTGEAGREEIKTVKVPASNGISLAASSATGPIIRFEQLSGLPLPTEFEVTVSGTHAQLRTFVNPTGRPSVCSPDSSVNGVATC
jgi:prepilin-type N-terminal cleavage/methylation domain-containing protein